MQGLIVNLELPGKMQTLKGWDWFLIRLKELKTPTFNDWRARTIPWDPKKYMEWMSTEVQKRKKSNQPKTQDISHKYDDPEAYFSA